MNSYDILQVSPDATADEIKRAYRAAVKNIIRMFPVMDTMK